MKVNYVVYGSQWASVKKRTAKILTDILQEVNDFNAVTFDYETTSVADILFDAGTAAFGGRKAVVITNPTFLTNYSEEKRKDVEDFTNFMRQNPNAALIFVLQVAENKGKKPVFSKNKAISSFLRLVRLESIADIGRNEWPTAVKRLLTNRNMEMDDDAVQLLIERTGHDLTTIIHELDKLSCYGSHLTRDDVEALTPIPLETNFFAIADALIRQAPDKALNLLRDLFAQKYDPSRLIPLIASQLHFMYQVKYLTNNGASVSEINEELGLKNPYRTQIVQRQLYGVKESEILRLLKRLADLDFKIMTGQVERHLGLELLCLECLR